MRQALLLQFVGRNTIASAMRPHEGVGIKQAHRTISTGVLACTATLHEDPDLSDWLLYTNTAFYSGRGLAQVDGRVFERNGRLVASATTQVMIRKYEKGDSSSYGGRARAL